MLGIEDILRDVREDEKWLKIQDKNEWDTNPSSRAGVYDKVANNRLHDSKIDAERWPLAISSYKNYSCFRRFSEDDVVTREKYYFSTTDYYMHYVKKNGENIRIQADLLTNYGTIHKLIDCFPTQTDDEKNIVHAFDRIAYTIGAFCPIWKNPGGRGAVKDTVWDKLLHSGLVDSEGRIKKECIALEDRENGDNLNKRNKENLFLISSDNKDPQSVIDSLYFQDYFSCKWELIYKFGSIRELRNKDEAYRYIKDIIVLIVQRSYRIITNNPKHNLQEGDQNIIKNVLSSIGLNDVECICSEKKRG